jgi:hypothetical protein
MKIKHITLIVTLFIVSNIIGQEKLDRIKAEASVTKYMTAESKKYKSLTFGEFFEQTYPKEIQAKMKANRNVVYSLVHTYTVGEKKYVDTYFHLDGKYQVVGKLTIKEMHEVSKKIENSNGKLDSIMNSLIPDSAPSH